VSRRSPCACTAPRPRARCPLEPRPRQARARWTCSASSASRCPSTQPLGAAGTPRLAQVPGARPLHRVGRRRDRGDRSIDRRPPGRRCERRPRARRLVAWVKRAHWSRPPKRDRPPSAREVLAGAPRPTANEARRAARRRPRPGRRGHPPPGSCGRGDVPGTAPSTTTHAWTELWPRDVGERRTTVFRQLPHGTPTPT